MERRHSTDYVNWSKIDAGEFGEVFKAIDRRSNQKVAIKVMKTKYRSKEEGDKEREVKTLRKLRHHTNVVRLFNTFFENGVFYIVYEFMDSNLLDKIRESRGGMDETRVRNVCFQVFLGIEHLHRNGFFHRDMKPENILCQGDTVKIADFGLAKEIRSAPPFTTYISTRWYRAPELLLSCENYNSPVDVWACGCILYELYTGNALFAGKNDFDMINKICARLGDPKENDWAEGHRLAKSKGFRFPRCEAVNFAILFGGEAGRHVSQEAMNLLKSILRWNSVKRPSANHCLKHPFFDIERRSAAANHSDGKQATNQRSTDNDNKTQRSTQSPIRSLKNKRSQQELPQATHQKPAAQQFKHNQLPLTHQKTSPVKRLSSPPQQKQKQFRSPPGAPTQQRHQPDQWQKYGHSTLPPRHGESQRDLLTRLLDEQLEQGGSSMTSSSHAPSSTTPTQQQQQHVPSMPLGMRSKTTSPPRRRVSKENYTIRAQKPAASGQKSPAAPSKWGDLDDFFMRRQAPAPAPPAQRQGAGSALPLYHHQTTTHRDLALDGRRVQQRPNNNNDPFAFDSRFAGRQQHDTSGRQAPPGSNAFGGPRRLGNMQPLLVDYSRTLPAKSNNNNGGDQPFGELEQNSYYYNYRLHASVASAPPHTNNNKARAETSLRISSLLDEFANNAASVNNNGNNKAAQPTSRSTPGGRYAGTPDSLRLLSVDTPPVSDAVTRDLRRRKSLVGHRQTMRSDDDWGDKYPIWK